MIGQAQAPRATAAAFQDAAEALDLAARNEKRLEALHRRNAREIRQRLDRLVATCSALGIALVIHHRSQPGGTEHE